jgi:Tfp pilus assembly protein PilO
MAEGGKEKIEGVSKKINQEELASTLKKNSKPKKPRDRKTLVKIYIIPVLAIMLFFYIIFGLIFQKISGIFNQLDEIESKQFELDNREQEIASLQSAIDNLDVLQNSLTILNSLAPSAQTEVVEFQEKVEFLAIQNNLTITSQRLNDQASDSTDLTVLDLKQIPSVFEIVGSKEDIDDFIDDFSLIDDFIVVREMQYSGSVEDDTWRLELTTIKYQFGESDGAVIESYEAISIDAEIPLLVDQYIQERL